MVRQAGPKNLIDIKLVMVSQRTFLRHDTQKEREMTTDSSIAEPGTPDEPVPMMQKLLDNPFLLLFLGVMIPMVVYTVWGVFDILTVPLAK